ncbi:MAG TPA: hypothetical protein VIY69_09235 [Candidatus Acidoferrales bacterium]
MERRVTVNDRIERLELEVPPELQAAEMGAKPARRNSQGPCLYFGPKGERCSRPALEGGYCAAHQANGAASLSARSYSRVLAATIALILIVWPYISDLVRDLLHWLASSR